MNKNVFRGQLLALLVGLLAPWICNLLYLLDLSPLPHFDLTLLGLTITSIAVSVAILRYRFLDILPVVHRTLIENMTDGLLVLDDQSKIVEMNPAAEELFRQPLKKLLIQPVAEALTDFPDFLASINNITNGKGYVTHINLLDGHTRFFDLVISPIPGDSRGVPGRMVVFRDCTELVESSNNLKHREEILVAIRFAAAQFMKSIPWEEISPEILM